MLVKIRIPRSVIVETECVLGEIAIVSLWLLNVYLGVTTREVYYLVVVLCFAPFAVGMLYALDHKRREVRR